MSDEFASCCSSGYVEAMEKAGFRKLRFRDESRLLLDLVRQIEMRIERLGDASLATQTEFVDGSIGTSRARIASTLAAAKAFVESGGLGYGVVTGRR